MKKLSIVLISLVICFLIAASTVRSASPSPNFQFRGIAPEDEKYYKSSEFIKCKDGSKKFGKAQLNDNFCDCVDGTDEPGTSACPNGRFYCRNRGHVPQVLFSSRVNDGICDCCDGSDEYDNRVTCPNTCWKAGKVARDKLKKKIATYKEGVTIRKQEVERAKVSIAKDEAELLKLQSEEKTLKGLVQELKERKEQIEKEEEKEHLRKEKEENEKREAEEKRKAEVEAKQENGEVVVKADGEVKAIESKDDDKIGSLEDSPSDPDNTEAHDALAAEHIPSDTTMNEQPSIHNVEAHPAKEIEASEAAPDVGSKASPDEFVNAGNDISENTEGLSKEELGRLVASRWTGQKTGKKTENVAEKDNNVEDNEGTEELPDDTHDHDDDGYASETDDEHHRYDADLIEDEVEEEFKEDSLDSSSSESSESSESDTESDSSEETFPSSTSWLEKIQQKVRNILQAINLFQTPVTPSDAARIRKEYDESSAKLSKIQGRISSLTLKLKLDFGLDKEFYPFYDQCFESKQNKYVYKVCPFKKASQVEGHSTTSLGRWDKFEDSYSVMVFSNGDRCWNGPDRSLKVKLRCGLKNEVADVDEPSRCEYVALLSTPAVCLEEKLKELQHKLDLMNKEQPQSHEEL